MDQSDRVNDPEDAERSAETTPVPDEIRAAPAATRRERWRHSVHRVRLYSWTALLVASLVVLVALIVDNTRRVKIGWVFGSSHASLVWIILAAAVVGWLAGLATSLVVRRRIRRAIEP